VVSWPAILIRATAQLVLGGRTRLQTYASARPKAGCCMSSGCPSRPVRGRTSLAHGLIAALVACVASIADLAYGDARPLRVCADPVNLPYSSREESGYENQIARLLAQELH